MELNLEQGDHKLKDGVYLRKEKDNYRLIYPVKKDLSQPFSFKNIHWKNFIGIQNWLSTLIIILVIVMSLTYMRDTELCREIVANPYKICGYQFGVPLNETLLFPNITWDSKEGDIVDEYNISLHT